MTVIVRGRAGAELGRTVVGAAAAALLGAEARLVDQACGQVGMITVHAAVDHRDLAALAAQAERIQTRHPDDSTGLLGRERRARPTAHAAIHCPPGRWPHTEARGVWPDGVRTW